MQEFIIGIAIGAILVKMTLVLDYWRAKKLLKLREAVTINLMNSEQEKIKEENNRVLLKMKELQLLNSTKDDKLVN